MKTPLAVLIGALCLVPSVSLAQGKSPPQGGGETDPRPEDKLDEAKKELEEDQAQATDDAKQAEGKAHSSAKGLEEAKLRAIQAHAGLAAAAAEVAKLERALKDAEAAQAKAADAAEAEGASDDAKQALTAAKAVAEQARTTLAAGEARAEKLEALADAADAEAAAAADKEAQAEAEAADAAAAKRDAEIKLRAANAAKAAMERAASMKRGPAIPLDELSLRIKPMDEKELKAEADAWQTVLKTKATGISYAEIATRHSEGEEKAAVLEALTKLRGEQTAVVDRLNLVLSAYKAKGGDPSSHHKYIAAATGISLDVKDAGALWTTVYGWVSSPEGGIRWAINLGWFLGTILVFRILGGVLGRVVERALRSDRLRTSDLLKDFLVNVIRKALIFVGVIVALSALEVDIGPLAAAMGGASLVVGFALQGTLSNFASGVMILMYRPYDLGDVVEVAGVKGSVLAMTLVSTSLVTPDNQEVIVPNSSIWGGVITNVTSRTTRRVDLVAAIGYGDDIPKAEALLLSILAAHEKVLNTPEPIVKVNELADSSVNFIVRPWCRTSDYWDVYWDLTREIKLRFDAEGISMPFPQADVHVHQVSTP
jgi:small conductance mechanosensitive channel